MFTSRSRQRYVFTLEDVRLSCGPALLQPADANIPPTVSLTWRSGKKTAFGGAVRALQTPQSGGPGAVWSTPISLACSLSMSRSGSAPRFEARTSEIVCRIEGAAASRRRLAVSLDLAAHASYQRLSSRLALPLPQGAGTLHVSLSSVWLKKPHRLANGRGHEDDDDEFDSMSDSTNSTNTVDSSLGDPSLRSLSSHLNYLSPVRESTTLDGPDELSATTSAPPSKPAEPLECDVTARKEYVPSPLVARAAGARRGHQRSASGGAARGAPPAATRSFSCSNLPQAHCAATADAADAAPAAVAHEGDGANAEAGTSLDGAVVESGEDGVGASLGSATARQLAAHSLVAVPPEAMEEVLSTQLPGGMDIDAVQQAFLGMDCEDSRFGLLLCRRLGYSQVDAAPWEGNEATGLTRSIQMLVKCPPKPMLPDMTRVHIRHRMLRLSPSAFLFEREVGMLDVPYGESFRVQERWYAECDAVKPGETAMLQVLAHVHFRSRGGLMASKIKHHSIKKARKVALLALDLLRQSYTSEGDDAPLASVGGSADVELQERHDALLSEVAYLRRHAQQLERENRKLQSSARYVRKSRRVLVETIEALEAALAREKREKATMEEVLTEAYNSTLRELVRSMEGDSGGASGGGGDGRDGRRGGRGGGGVVGGASIASSRGILGRSGTPKHQRAQRPPE